MLRLYTAPVLLQYGSVVAITAGAVEPQLRHVATRFQLGTEIDADRCLADVGVIDTWQDKGQDVGISASPYSGFELINYLIFNEFKKYLCKAL